MAQQALCSSVAAQLGGLGRYQGCSKAGLGGAPTAAKGCGPALELNSKADFSSCFSKKKKPPTNPTQINAEKKNKPFPKALEEGFPASLALSFPFEGCSISSDVL